MEAALHKAMLSETRRRLLREGIPRLRQCLDLLEEAEIWYRPNAHSNSVGNLVLHLCGNVRQWVIHGLGGKPDTRRRQAEFDEQGPLSAGQLHALLDQLEQDLAPVLTGITPSDLAYTRKVQGFDETGVGILMHVVEHFSYHVGQVVYFVKARKDLDLGFYRGQDLDATG